MIHPFENIGPLFTAPAVRETEKFSYPGIRQVFIPSVPYRGKPTEVFACYGLPENADGGTPIPGVVLVHGGGATALANWVELWNKRGYAAVSMDTCGRIPAAAQPYDWMVHGWQPHETGGPQGWGRFEAAEDAPEEQWVYHAVAAVIAAHSFLRSLPEVDPRRVGLTGISWGGVLSCIAAALDRRFSWFAPVYGCGFLNTPDSCLGYSAPDITDDLRQKWCDLWDPARYLRAIDIPAFFLAGTNDASFPLDSLRNTLSCLKDARSLIHVEYPHNHVISWEEETVFYFADAMSGNRGVPRPGAIDVKDGILQSCLDGPRPTEVFLNWTRGSGWWNGRKWEKTPAEYCDGMLKAAMPRCFTAGYFTASFADGVSFSTPVWRKD